MMRVKIDGPDGKVYKVDVPEGATPEATVEKFSADMWPNLKEDTGLKGALNTARISGTAATGALTGALDMPINVASAINEAGGHAVNWGMRKLGLTSMTLDQLRERRRKAGYELAEDYRPSVTKAAEALGVPTDSTAEAKRLGVPLTEGRAVQAKGIDFAVGAGALGAGKKIAALTGIGGATGQAAMGDEGAMALGIALPLLGIRATAPKLAAAPTLEEVKIARKAAYSTADQGGAVLSQGSLGRMLQDMHLEMAPKYFAKDTHPQAFKAFRELTDEVSKGHVDAGRLFKMRGRMGALKGASGTAGQDANMIGTMRSVMDRHLSSAQPIRDVIAGDMKAIQAFKEGTQLFRREMGVKTIEKLVERAKDSASTYTAAGYDTALRNQFRAFVKSNEMRFFTKPEQAALRRVARGTVPGNVMRQLGRLAPNNILNALMLASVHPAAALATVPAAGARYAASKSTQRNIKLAKHLVASGRPVPSNLRRYLDAAPAVGAVAE